MWSGASVRQCELVKIPTNKVAAGFNIPKLDIGFIY